MIRVGCVCEFTINETCTTDIYIYAAQLSSPENDLFHDTTKWNDGSETHPLPWLRWWPPRWNYEIHFVFRSFVKMSIVIDIDFVHNSISSDWNERSQLAVAIQLNWMWFDRCSIPFYVCHNHLTERVQSFVSFRFFLQSRQQRNTWTLLSFTWRWQYSFGKKNTQKNVKSISVETKQEPAALSFTQYECFHGFSLARVCVSVFICCVCADTVHRELRIFFPFKLLLTCSMLTIILTRRVV